ncbi:ABC transporter substrate-binding protein [Cerasicoccus arenae]|uniref:Extracellular solute-binding protein n=1 Tax=Cerasicoccus arenae TaxID=424488 RepID=A0A8J3DK53_9BACT|nr:extracellular solute-binding protein [Cerasicoccus arenae]MBK1859219.1 extracellular solute-binding protein [Cerasicoccus arenae]GHC02686.1 hypothetical protein GCM10007047_19140 [Cerasicoccus arenae]
MKNRLNYVAISLLVFAYLLSAGRFLRISLTGGDGEDADSKVIRIAHWQLEPGYREALDWAMSEYMKLPKVQEAGIRVEQVPINQRIYNQFMNVHLISGTAPDIAARNSQVIASGNTARFYSAMDSYISQPNPYNAQKFLADGLDPALAEYLSASSWQDTAVDGMRGGYDEILDGYYGIPVSTLGNGRIYYNDHILKLVKAFIKEQIQQSPQPDWLTKLWIDRSGDKVKGYLPDNQRLREWLALPRIPPETLGQFILYCSAVKVYGKAINDPYLVPISVGNYGGNNLCFAYEPIFLSNFSEGIEGPIGSGVDGFETAYGWSTERWSFDDEPIREYINLTQLLTSFYPEGFLGLDREQAMRRFILGKAAMISSGGWDAASIFMGAQNRDDPDDRFEPIIRRAPIPAEGERWAKLLPYQTSEASFLSGVALSVNNTSKNFDWAVDFLQFVTSQPINEELNRRSGWLPATGGAETIEKMKAFIPQSEGFPRSMSISFGGATAAMRREWVSQSLLAMAGDITYEDFKSRMVAILNDPIRGMRGYWISKLTAIKDQSRALDRMVSTLEYRAYLNDDQKSETKLQSLVYKSLNEDEGVQLEWLWKDTYPNESYPTNNN